MSTINFFKSPLFAVVGASADTSKFGYRVLDWYIRAGLPATPINPKTETIASLKCVKSITDLENPANYSLSLIVPPAVTLEIIKQAKSIGIKNLWLQPGCENAEVYELLKRFDQENAGLNVILGGPCILVEGEYSLNQSRL
ncbi:hypothetical protein HDU79_009827 [Rhizoclosmatium sp. JEL0117]|nr:hypothetical protein HDU79_009827 [Rhizoclosmatium sp. JEL0117]